LDSESSSLSVRQHIVAYTENGVIDAVGFGRLVAGITLQVRNLPEQRWALVCQDTLWFAAGFLALTQASKTIILPQTNQPSSVQTARATAILTDQPMRFSSFVTLDPAQAADADGLGSMDLDPQLNIELYTSGSTGQPKRVDKYLGQLHAEVTELENMWGGMLGDAVVVATVPHHHLYGLLFRFLWPWWMKRPFYTLTCTQPFMLSESARRFGRCVLVSSPAFLTRVTDDGVLTRGEAYPGLFSSGAPLPQETAIRLASQLGHPVIEVYGSTETGGVAWRSRNHPTDDQSWRPFPSVQTEISAAESDMPGRLRVCSPWTWHGEWVDTGDLSERHSRERFLLHGRADNILKVEDKRASLVEMQERLAAHELVSEARMVLLEGKRMSVGAVVVLNARGRNEAEREGVEAVRRELIKQLRVCYDPVLIPRKWRFVPLMPGNSMGKTEKAELQALFKEGH